MSIRKIYAYPEPVLRQKAKVITIFDENLKLLIEDMADTMWDAPGVGLAAPQIGESLKLIVVDITKEDEEQQYMPLINPEIISSEGSQVDEEGCLSVPELTSNVTRFKKIKVQYQDQDGNKKEIETEGRFAVVLQHEIDHLNGVLFIDHLSSLKRSLYKKKVKKWLSN